MADEIFLIGHRAEDCSALGGDRVDRGWGNRAEGREVHSIGQFFTGERGAGDAIDFHGVTAVLEAGDFERVLAQIEDGGIKCGHRLSVFGDGKWQALIEAVELDPSGFGFQAIDFASLGLHDIAIGGEGEATDEAICTEGFQQSGRHHQLAGGTWVNGVALHGDERHRAFGLGGEEGPKMLHPNQGVISGSLFEFEDRACHGFLGFV